MEVKARVTLLALAVIAGLFVVLLVLVLTSTNKDTASSTNGVFTKCRDLTKPNGTILCGKDPDEFCMTMKCEKGEVNSCASIEKMDRKPVCSDLYDYGDCSYQDLGEMKKGPGACQICTTDMCNNGDLPDGVDWNNGTIGPFAVNWLLMIAGINLLLLGQNAIN